MTMIALRTIAPAIMNQQQQQNHHHQQQVKGPAPGMQFSGSVVKSNYVSKKKLHNHQSQYTTGPLPSIERRNARERNRVKAVNNGFEKLRQYIPAKIVEVEKGGRGASKKISKVDTLKFAVKYIQRLKEMLDENDSQVAEASEEVQSTVSCASSTSSYYSASPAPSSHYHHQPMYLDYASTPMRHYQQENHQTYSEPSVSPAPSYHSDVSSHHPQSVYQMPNVQFSAIAVAEECYPKGYSQAQFEDEDSGAFEEEGILDDILQWQLQN